MSDKTLKVKSWHKSQGDFVIIGEADFDKDAHTLFGDKKPTAKEQKALDEQAAAELLTATKAKLSEKGVTFEEAATQAELQTLLDAAE
ncbi:MAG TPA: hypothetical protein DIW52_27275 [Pseudomonas sp.]|jgi:hypothetical protein|nr:hypothetical protein [Pseudomonas sp.]